ncbi:MAG: DUF255 domain-containing protein [Bacteroidetes bacterium]|nr:DUF255 domain-containing protein [Bacteroidota bacterium]
MKKLLALISFLIIVSSSYSQSIQWRSYESAVALAQTSNKIVMVKFYTDWCKWCKRMDETTFKDEAIVKYISEHFRAVKINPEKKGSVNAKNGKYSFDDFARSARVSTYPSIAFFYPNGRLITVRSGFQDGSTLLALLKYVKEGVEKENKK